MPLGHPRGRALVADIRQFLADQGHQGLQGLDVPEGLLRPRAPAPAPALTPALARTASTPAPSRAQAGPAPWGESPTLRAVRDTLGDCTRCGLAAHRTSIVFGVGDPEADLMLVGEAPGRDEDLMGEPFVGEAGRLLDRMLGAMGLSRQSVYIANIIKCRPPKNRFPEKDEVSACAPFVRGQMAAIKPRVVVALGRLAAHSLLGTQTPISRLRGQWGHCEGIAVMPTFHPAYLLRNPGDKGLVWQDLKAVMASLGLQMPNAQAR